MPERRLAARQRSFLQGRVYFNNRRASVDCLVRDISETGARLKFPAPVSTPDMVELYLPGKDETFRARVQWRVADEMGVGFVLEGSPPLVPGPQSADLEVRLRRLEAEFAMLQQKVAELQAALRQTQGADD
jgi:hypothetical protein